MWIVIWKTVLVFTFAARSCCGIINARPSPVPSRELKIEQLHYYIHTDEGRTVLANEFDTIQGGQRRNWTVAAINENTDKNRYDDILAFDETRVVLETLQNDYFSDYINANYIDGQNRKMEYIATQGPLPITINDFWRMIWKLNVTKIIMLANILEDGEIKVEKYWPEFVNTYGDIKVTKILQFEMPKIQHVVRTFSLRKTGSDVSRFVRHFHFTGWPDFGTPADKLSILAIIDQARKYKAGCTSPIVIHCSGGVGRTGSVILSDSMIQKAISEGVVDFPKRLDHMRIQRVNIVETKEQYAFAHQAVYDYFKCNKTEKYLRSVDSEYKKYNDDFNSDTVNNFPSILQKIEWHTNGIRKLISALEHTSASEEISDTMTI